MAVSLVEVFHQEALNIFDWPRLDQLAEWLETCDHVRYSRLLLVQKLWQGDCGFLATSACSDFRDLRVVDHVVVPHQDFSLLAELMGQEDAAFILLLIFHLEDEIETGDLLFYVAVVAPSDLV